MTDVLVVIGVGGMGEAIARRSGPGRKVVLADFDERLLEGVTTGLSGDGYDVEGVPVDVSSRASVAALADVAAALGPVTRIAHTAGLSPIQASSEAILSVDVLGVVHALEEFGRVVAPGGAGVVVASMAGTIGADAVDAETERALRALPADELLQLPALQEAAKGDPGTAYRVAKRANQLRVQAASLVWGARGARVNSISPGIISTPMGKQELAGERGDGMRAMIQGSGTGRVGTPGDIASAVAFLLGPDAAFITGADLLIDGGVVAALRAR